MMYKLSKIKQKQLIKYILNEIEHMFGRNVRDEYKGFYNLIEIDQILESYRLLLQDFLGPKVAHAQLDYISKKFKVRKK